MFDPAHGAGVTAVVTVVGTLVGTALSVAVVLLPPETRSEVAAPIVAQAANKGLASSSSRMVAAIVAQAANKGLATSRMPPRKTSRLMRSVGARE